MVGRLLRGVGANRAVLALSMSRLGDALGNSILYIVIPLYVDKLGAPWFNLPETVRVGMLLSLYGLVNSAFQPVMGAVSDHLKRHKPLIEGGMFLMAVSILAFSFARHFRDLLLFRSLQGLGLAMVLPATMALMAASTEKRTRGGAMGVYTTMRMVGFAAGPLIGGFLHVHFGFNAAFYAGAGFVMIGLLLVRLWVRDAPAPENEDRRPFKIIDRELMGGGIIGLAVATFVMANAFSMVITLERQFNERLNLTALGFGIAFSALMISRLLFQIPLGRLSDRIGRKPLIIAGLALMAPVTALLGEAGSGLELTWLRLLQGLASAAVAAPAFALAADLSRRGGEARQMGVITLGFSLGIAVGPLISGVLAIAFFDLPFMVGGFMSLVGAWVVYRFVPETVSRKPAGR
jgi:MFS family permease